MLTGKQKRHLRSLAHHVQPIFQIGKGGVNDQLIRHIDEAIETRELIKISVLQNCDEDRNVIAAEISERSGCELVQVIGKTIVLYKESKDHKEIVLPRA
ncbi:ribosome assembly RNA-binding protein YhbY [Paenibacillus sp. ACRRX]|uniref:ribosome assembly RNA-binding protein YhbY n=1 Tax=unclassified Paenibacillus TaxID=185978 RepID=UPI001EF6365A|nr:MULTISPECIES: ribosome assembly RNA-binding protein YhbY [unclassified Paenibacillus]MCG7407901.1 ribosome assembly RNA-binding protein YhbY [Paenibacillus sp. ACRRX]MDK8181044.1 ribosome assembly RNA-binding protein YhbY [Paenibacillus sp. UMB4589-SE434]